LKSHFILYVSDQEKSTGFYEIVLSQKATLNVPGMTEFKLNDNCTLGLMPSMGIKKLLGGKMPDPSTAQGIPRAELYLEVNNPEGYHARALQSGAVELSEMKVRDWGHKAAYSLDLDGHVIAFAKAC
jgi:predicted enzyme related to lactoylglutathione lyase